MERASRRPWLQFSLRTLLIAMLMVASFFGGRISLQRELNELRAVKLDLLRAKEAAAEAERAVLNQWLLDQAQAQLNRSADNVRTSSTEALDQASPKLPLPKAFVADTPTSGN
jgi:hypothetical protein